MKLYIETMGCPKNFNDSEGIGGIWEAAGLTVTDNPLEADALLINTCGFINDAKVESIDKIFEMARFIEDTREDKEKMLIVTGCLTQRFGDDLFEEIPEIDVIMGVNDYEKLPDIVRSFARGERQKHTSCCVNEFTEFTARKYKENPYTSTIRIAEGCNNCCTYCVIPLIRGGFRSRPMQSIINEAEVMACEGTKELILIAQDVTEYGTDLYDGKLMLPELLRRLCKVEGIEWIRLMYCYEDKITDELIEVMKSEKKICHYIDIPLQHVADNVLEAMNRRSTSQSIRSTIARLRSAMPDIHIRTTFITGFPGETEENFETLYDFVCDTKFERLGVFAYSREEGTVAGDMPDQIDEEIKAQRADSIMRRQIEISKEVNDAKVGSTMTVMVDSMDEDGAYVGRTQYDAPEIDNSVIFQSGRKLNPGDMVDVTIIDAFDYDLVGKMED